MTPADVLGRWRTYWFAPGRCFDLAFLRIVLVALQCYVLLSYSFPALTYVLGLPDYMWVPQPIIRLLWLPFGDPGIPSTASMHLVFWLTLLVGVFSFIGLLTNVSLGLFALGNVILQAWIYSFRDIHHPEAIMMLALSVLAISPSGKVLSVDAWLRQRHGGNATTPLLEVEHSYARWPVLFLQLFFPLMYLSAVISKLTRGGIEWANGISLQYYMILEAYKSDSALAAYFSQFQDLLRFSEYVVLVFQATFFLIIFFPRLKWIYLPLGLFFHVSIYVIMRAPFPQWILLYAIYVPWSEVFRRLAQARVPVVEGAHR